MTAADAGRTSAPGLSDFILLNEEIAALVRARVPLESSLARIGAELPGKSGQLADRISRRMQDGESLAAAMDAECRSMPPAYRAAILAGVESGQLGSALQAVVESASRSYQLRRVTAIALLYPLILAMLVCLLLALVVAVVVPSFGWLDHSTFWPIEPLSRSPLAVPLLGIVAPLLLLLAAAVWWWRSGGMNALHPSSGWITTLSGSARVARWSRASQFAELLLLLVERGLPLHHSLRLASEACGDRGLRDAAHAMAQRIEQGDAREALHAASQTSRRHKFPVLIRLALHHAANRLLLTAGLRQAAVMYHDRAIRAAEWYTEYLPILLTVAIGGTLTITFALVVLWPYASMLYELSHWHWG